MKLRERKAKDGDGGGQGASKLENKKSETKRCIDRRKRKASERK